jgi:serine/threonine protein phosphatase PrpC
VTWAVEAAMRSLKGPQKTENEDTAAVAGVLLRADAGAAVTVRPRAGAPVVVLVADGMGGHAGGRVASGLVAERLSGDHGLLEGDEGIAAALDRAQAGLFDAMRADPALRGMGTTVVGIAIQGSGPARAFNVGDSRLLLRHPEVGVVQLTVDDAERDGTGTTSTLSQALGGTAEPVPLAPHLRTVDLQDRDRLVLCTDGLSDSVGKEAIAGALAGADAAGAADALVEAARAAGATDDVTVVVVDVIEA